MEDIFILLTYSILSLRPSPVVMDSRPDGGGLTSYMLALFAVLDNAPLTAIQT